MAPFQVNPGWFEQHWLTHRAHEHDLRVRLMSGVTWQIALAVAAALAINRVPMLLG